MKISQFSNFSFQFNNRSHFKQLNNKTLTFAKAQNTYIIFSLHKELTKLYNGQLVVDRLLELWFDGDRFGWVVLVGLDSPGQSRLLESLLV